MKEEISEPAKNFPSCITIKAPRSLKVKFAHPDLAKVNSKCISSLSTPTPSIHRPLSKVESFSKEDVDHSVTIFKACLLEYQHENEHRKALLDQAKKTHLI